MRWCVGALNYVSIVMTKAAIAFGLQANKLVVVS